jgi:peptidoglycan/xylan/chitin deacetylase (PgdA/CDA1 family)
VKIPSIFFLSLLSVVVWAGPEQTQKRVALVFDDGPIPGDAGPLVELLKKEHVNCTFSLVGFRVEAHPETARLLSEAGEEVVNHSQTHAHPAPLTDAQLETEVSGAQKVITSATGKAPRWYWPPFLEKDKRVFEAAKRAGLTIYEPKHLVVSRDYDTTVPAAEILRLATTDVQDGTVILFHEWRKDTLAQLPAILSELRRQNCHFMTFSELADALAKSP